MNILKAIKNSAIVLGAACLFSVVTFSAIKADYAETDSKLLTTTWVYVGPDLENVTNFNSSNYIQNPGTLPPTCNLDDKLPCQFIVPATVNTIVDLENYLIGLYGDDPEAIRDHADTQKGM